MKNTAITAILLAACTFTPRAQATVAPRTPTNTERVTISGAEKLDVLFVVDDSGSMSQKQARLGAALPTFLDTLQGLSPGLSWRIGVITTDVYRTEVLRNAAALSNPWVDLDVCPPATCDATEAITKNLKAGVTGSGDEKPLLAIMRALDPAFGYDVGFRRPDADLLVVIVTDEEDSSCTPVRLDQGGCSPPISMGLPGYYARFLRGQAVAPLQVRVAALIGEGTEVLSGTVTGCRTEGNANDVAQDAPRIREVVEGVGGVVESICQANLEPALQRIATASLRAPRIVLDRVPSTTSLNVVVAPADRLERGVDYDYVRCDAMGKPVNAVQFKVDRMPAPGSTVVVSYEVDASTTACQ